MPAIIEMTAMQPNRKTLSSKIIVLTILFSSFLALLITGVQLFNKYQSRISFIEDGFNYISESNTAALSSSLWGFDEEQTLTILKGIQNSPIIERVEIHEKEAITWEVGNKISENSLHRTYELSYGFRGDVLKLGVLSLYAGLDDIYRDLVYDALFLFGSNAVKTLFVAGFMLILFHHLITRHLNSIVRHLSNHKTDKEWVPIYLNKKYSKPNHYDEIDLLAYTVNELHADIDNFKNNLERMVNERTSELVAAKEEAERANAAKSEFLSSMSHEFRTPLNAILGFSTMLKEDSNLTVDQRGDILRIEQSGKHLLDMVNQLLDLSRIENGHLDLEISDINIPELLEECMEHIMPLANERGITIEPKLNARCTAISDKVRTKQIILNLLSNAIKYNSENGKIIIMCIPSDEDHLKVTVTDSGDGISPDLISKIFRPFERLQSSHNVIEGAGVGLALVKKLVKELNGHIGVDSQPGKGSTFWFTLPMAKT